MDTSEGKWWDKGIQLNDGCTPCSPGCDHCWSAGMAHRFKRHQMNKFDFNPPKYTEHGGKFNGHITLHLDRLEKAVRARKPQVFAIWNDLFHEEVPYQFISRVFNKIHDSHGKHTFLLLTKRADNMKRFIDWYINSLNEDRNPSGANNVYFPRDFQGFYLGLTVCNQAEADAKIPIFLQVPGKKFLSIEPLLGPVDFSYNRFCGVMGWGPPDPPRLNEDPSERLKGQARWILGNIDAVILGGETGPGARPMRPDWVRSIRDQCAAASVPFFFKQWGEWRPCEGYGEAVYSTSQIECINEPNQDLTDWTFLMAKVGRKKAGRVLEGRTHDDLPWKAEP